MPHDSASPHFRETTQRIVRNLDDFIGSPRDKRVHVRDAGLSWVGCPDSYLAKPKPAVGLVRTY
jgi:hypothetical protein